MSSASSIKQVLLEWCRSKTIGYQVSKTRRVDFLVRGVGLFSNVGVTAFLCITAVEKYNFLDKVFVCVCIPLTFQKVTAISHDIRAGFSNPGPRGI